LHLSLKHRKTEQRNSFTAMSRHRRQPSQTLPPEITICEEPAKLFDMTQPVQVSNTTTPSAQTESSATLRVTKTAANQEKESPPNLTHFPATAMPKKPPAGKSAN
ncbi:hypothetical protein O6P43_020981, partial [Quillaja saponaria]